MNTLAGYPLSAADLSTVAARLGSDCALFLHDLPVVMRGRGEQIQALEKPAAERLSGRRLLMFKPSFGIKTPWAYQQMIAAAPKSYLPSDEAEARLSHWLKLPTAPAETLVFNNMEAVAFRKFLALPTLLEKVRERFGVTTGMSGSGSASFALLKPDSPLEAICAVIRAAWGESVFVQEAEIR
jgi:4-diphosphocytidyl-2-C-methyl-D-erythritol kinase